MLSAMAIDCTKGHNLCSKRASKFSRCSEKYSRYTWRNLRFRALASLMSVIGLLDDFRQCLPRPCSIVSDEALEDLYSSLVSRFNMRKECIAFPLD